MITRDEAAMVGQALESVQGLVSEIVVVDTGSVDETVEIATCFGAKVLHRTWDDDFAAARNISLKHASCDWILVLDADEAIAAGDHATLRKLIGEKNVCYEFMQRHYTNDVRLSGFTPCAGVYPDFERDFRGYFESNCCRLFPRDPQLKFRGRIHELVEHAIHDSGSYRILRTSVPIHHYGHTPEVTARKNKSRLYTPLGQRKAEEQPDTWKSHFELGVEHNCNGRHRESIRHFMKATELEPSYVPTWTNLGYALMEVGEFEQAKQALEQAISLDPNTSEAHCNLGVVALRRNELEQAESHFHEAIRLNPSYLNAIFNLGQTLLRMKRFDQAVEMLENVLSKHPEHTGAIAHKGLAELQQGNYQRAVSSFETAIGIEPCFAEAHYYLGQTYRHMGDSLKAISALEAFCLIVEKIDNPTQKDTLDRVRNECALLRAFDT